MRQSPMNILFDRSLYWGNYGASCAKLQVESLTRGWTAEIRNPVGELPNLSNEHNIF
jgi:hypothetical protein